jgi:hypothetical protein
MGVRARRHSASNLKISLTILVEDYILPGEVWDRISDAIDENCEAEDANAQAGR